MSNEEVRVEAPPRASSWRTRNRVDQEQNAASNAYFSEHSNERNRNRTFNGASGEVKFTRQRVGGPSGRLRGYQRQRNQGSRNTRDVVPQHGTAPDTEAYHEDLAEQTVSKLNVHAEVFTPGHAEEPNPRDTSRKSTRRNPRQQNDNASATYSQLGDASKKPARRAPRRKLEESKAQKESLEEQLQNGSYDCVICCLRVRNVQPIWNCQLCFHIFHLRCVAEWAQTSISQENPSWRCPACQGESAVLPAIYQCFCGKQKNPPCGKSCLPHSCGQLCLKPRSCAHKCNRPCHPGRCPPCEAIVSRSCHCAKTSTQIKCDSKMAFHCEKLCGKNLLCMKHTCQDRCHPGDCPPCEESKTIRCTCGRTSRAVSCDAEDEFNCDQPCARTLDCGNHVCSVVCHDGPCGKCQIAQIKSCPCGKMPLSETWNCSQEVPLCTQSCEKTLKCGHSCTEKCHSGECPPCTVAVKGKRCRCGFVVEDAECGQTDLLCRRRCNKKKVCGRHKCLDECCDKEYHICDLVCGKILSCKLHSCQILCHKGCCPKCDNVSFDELSCHCGVSVLYPPIACNTSPPECTELCNREHTCSHPVRHPCHSEESCPPCTSLTEKKCHGGHEVRRNIPCHLENVSCGRPCGLPLACKRHKCDKICHSGRCPEKCEQPCTVPRECGHPCKLPCHESCPPSTCFANVDLTCACGRIVEPRSCHQFRLAVNNQIQQRIRRGEDVNLAVDLIQLSKGFLKCVEQCAIETRNKKMAEGFKIDPTNTLFSSGLYTDFVKDEARKNWQFASKIVQKLNELVELAKASPQVSRSFSFEPMPRDQRRFIYELLEAYRCTGQSYDQEPKRNIVVTAYREKSVVPTLSLASTIGFANPLPLRKLV